jgi:ribose 5-phosphate isomerase A
MAQTGKAGPIITDNGNVVIDAIFRGVDYNEMEQKINMIPGVVECGLVSSIPREIYVSDENGSIERASTQK